MQDKPAGGGLRKQVLLARLLSLIMLFSLFSSLVIPAQAASKEIIYIQTSIDLATWQIMGSVISVEVAATQSSIEKRRIPSDARQAMANSSETMDTAIGLLSGLSKAEEYDAGGDSYSGYEIQSYSSTYDTTDNNNVLTFPGDAFRGNFSSADVTNATNVLNGLIHDLNGAFTAWRKENNIDRTASVAAFRDSMVQFLQSVPDSASSDYASLTFDGLTTEYRWRYPKGYHTDTHVVDSGLIELSTGDAAYVNWAMLAYEAFYNFLLEGDEQVSDATVYTEESSTLGKALVKVFSGLLEGLRGILGLWAIDDLVFNTGFRAAGYVGGVFPSNWESIVWTLFMVMEVFATMILLYGLVVNVLKKAASTTNAIARMRAMEHIQDLIVCAVALALLPVLLRVVIQMSSGLTGIFYELVPSSASSGTKETVTEMVSQFGAGSGTLAGIIMQFMFFGVQIYFNAFYALRALSTALLVMIAPVMIAMISVSDSRKQATILWAKELLANICIQPIHAFCIGVMLRMPTSTHGFDNLLAIYAIIPLTSLIRSFFFGHSGSWMNQAANAARGKTTGAIAGAAVAGGGALIAGTASALANRKAGGSSGSESTAASNAQDKQGSSDTGEAGSQTPADGAGAGGTSAADNAGQGTGSGGGERRSFRETVSAAWNSAPSRIARGTFVSAVGGALSGAGFSGGRMIASTGSDIVRGQRSSGTTADRLEDPSKKSPDVSGDTNGADTAPDAFAPDENLDLESGSSPLPISGDDRGLALWGKEKEEMDYTELSAAHLSAMGISDVKGDKENISFKVSGDSPQAQEFGAYADYLNGLGKEERRAEMEARGVTAKRLSDGSVAVNLNKKDWSKANNGARLDVSGRNEMSLHTPTDSTEQPSFVGGVAPLVNVETDTAGSTHNDVAARANRQPEALVGALEQGKDLPSAIQTAAEVDLRDKVEQELPKITIEQENALVDMYHENPEMVSRAMHQDGALNAALTQVTASGVSDPKDAVQSAVWTAASADVQSEIKDAIPDISDDQCSALVNTYKENPSEYYQAMEQPVVISEGLSQGKDVQEAVREAATVNITQRIQENNPSLSPESARKVAVEQINSGPVPYPSGKSGQVAVNESDIKPNQKPTMDRVVAGGDAVEKNGRYVVTGKPQATRVVDSHASQVSFTTRMSQEQGAQPSPGPQPQPNPASDPTQTPPNPPQTPI